MAGRTSTQAVRPGDVGEIAKERAETNLRNEADRLFLQTTVAGAAPQPRVTALPEGEHFLAGSQQGRVNLLQQSLRRILI